MTLLRRRGRPRPPERPAHRRGQERRRHGRRARAAQGARERHVHRSRRHDRAALGRQSRSARRSPPCSSRPAPTSRRRTATASRRCCSPAKRAARRSWRRCSPRGPTRTARCPKARPRSWWRPAPAGPRSSSCSRRTARSVDGPRELARADGVDVGRGRRARRGRCGRWSSSAPTCRRAPTAASRRCSSRPGPARSRRSSALLAAGADVNDALAPAAKAAPRRRRGAGNNAGVQRRDTPCGRQAACDGTSALMLALTNKRWTAREAARRPRARTRTTTAAAGPRSTSWRTCAAPTSAKGCRPQEDVEHTDTLELARVLIEHGANVNARQTQ